MLQSCVEGQRCRLAMKEVMGDERQVLLVVQVVLAWKFGLRVGKSRRVLDLLVLFGEM